MTFEASDIEVDDSFSGVFDTWRKARRCFDQSLLGCALAFGVAAANSEVGKQQPRLRNGHPTPQASLPGAPCGGNECGAAAVTLEDGERFAMQIRLAA
jgi:hypothetical protein